MKHFSLWLSVLLASAVFLSGCKTVRIEGPEIKLPPAKKRLDAAKNSLKTKAQQMQFPAALGGLIASDSWVIYKDKQQEEFKGNVSYDNGVYTFRADYALSERAQNRFTAKGNVYVKQAEPGAPVYEAYADYARYNYKTQKGILTAAKKNTIRLIYQEGAEPPVTAYAQKAEFNLADGVFVLEGDVRVERPAPEGLQTLTAQKAEFIQPKNHLTLSGGAELSDSQRTLVARTIVYDGENNRSTASGARPLLRGTSEQGTFAIIADKVESDNAGRQVALNGKVQGWVVSPQLNDSEINDKF